MRRELPATTGHQQRGRADPAGAGAPRPKQGQYRAAIKHLERVLEISKEMAEFTGDADAYGSIADCYTELGDFESAAAFYDRYINVMDADGTPV
jgi:tetratricopeptide (TPR) repeat protein